MWSAQRGGGGGSGVGTDINLLTNISVSRSGHTILLELAPGSSTTDDQTRDNGRTISPAPGYF